MTAKPWTDDAWDAHGGNGLAVPGDGASAAWDGLGASTGGDPLPRQYTGATACPAQSRVGSKGLRLRPCRLAAGKIVDAVCVGCGTDIAERVQNSAQPRAPARRAERARPATHYRHCNVGRCRGMDTRRPRHGQQLQYGLLCFYRLQRNMLLGLAVAHSSRGDVDSETANVTTGDMDVMSTNMLPYVHRRAWLGGGV